MAIHAGRAWLDSPIFLARGVVAQSFLIAYNGPLCFGRASIESPLERPIEHPLPETPCTPQSRHGRSHLANARDHIQLGKLLPVQIVMFKCPEIEQDNGHGKEGASCSMSTKELILMFF